MFENRQKAGETLAKKLSTYAGANTIVYGLPRGGVPVAASVAKKLQSPLSLVFVKKIGAPNHSELAIGAVADGDDPTQVLNHDIVRSLHVSDLYIAAESEAALIEIERRRALYAGLFACVSSKDKTAIVTDDGLATGTTMEAAIKILRQQGANRIIVAIPVAPNETIESLESIADEIVCLEPQSSFRSVSGLYHEFPQLSDADVMEVLNQFLGDERSLVKKRG